MKFTIAVCTRNRSAHLLPTLNALTSLLVPDGHQCECLVIDNASTDLTPRVVSEFVERRPDRFRYVHEPVIGLSRARNRAIDEVGEGIIVYLDDDAVPHGGFLSAYASAYAEEPAAGCVGGKIVIALPSIRLPRWFGPELHGYLGEFDLKAQDLQECNSIGEYPYGGNISFLREAVVRAGYFNEHLGYTGTQLVGGEEEDLCVRIHRLDYKVFYQPTAIVTHIIQPQRITRQYFQRLAWANGIVWVVWDNEGRINHATRVQLRQYVKQAIRDLTQLASIRSPSAMFHRYLRFLENTSASWYCARQLKNSNLRRMTNAIETLLRPGTRARQTDHYKAALSWVKYNSIAKGGIWMSSVRRISYPEVTGYLIPTLLNCGEHQQAVQFAQWLLAIQNANGSWSDAAGKAPYTFDTGQILKGLLAILPRLPKVERAIRHGCDWMLTQIDTDGRVTTPDDSQWRLSDGQQIPESINIYALEPLRTAGKRFGDRRYIEAVERAVEYYLSQPGLTRFDTLSHFHGYVLEALVDLDYPEEAAQGMAVVERLQRPDGAVPGYPDADWVCSAGLAQYAVVWYKLGKRAQAVKALDCLSRLQNISGGFYGSYGKGANYVENQEISWAVKYFLDAYYWYVRTAFDAEATSFPPTIEETDGRVQVVLRGLGDVSGLRCLDAGCGKGRFSRILLARYPAADLWGVDLSDTMLRDVPSGINTRQGSLLNLPFEDGIFDRVFSVEALEHAINPEVAVQELCRVLKPGGRIVIVDKNARRYGTLQIEAWERWFERKEVTNWLSRNCNDVRSDLIGWGKQTKPDGLFIAWQGVRR